MDKMSVTCGECHRTAWIPADMRHIRGSKENKEAQEREKLQVKEYGFIIADESEPFHCKYCGKPLTVEDMD